MSQPQNPDQQQPSPKKALRKKKTGWGRILFWVLLLLFIAIQFFQPDKNNNNLVFTNDITTVVAVPDSVHQLLQHACYDCHSNNTEYPWYTNIQPVGWWLNSHINDGKRHLNFNEFATYSPEKQKEKLEETEDSQRKGWMPLKSYTWIHDDARLNEAQKQQIITWAKNARRTISYK